MGLVHSLQRYSSRILNSFSFNDALLAFTQCTLEDLSYREFISSVSMFLWYSSPWTSKKSSLCAHLHLINAYLADLYKFLSESIYLFSHRTYSPLRYSTTRGFPWVVVTLVCPPDTFFSNSTNFRCTLLALAKKIPMFCCVLLAQPKEPKMVFQLKKDRGIYLPTVNCNKPIVTTISDTMQSNFLFCKEGQKKRQQLKSTTWRWTQRMQIRQQKKKMTQTLAH